MKIFRFGRGRRAEYLVLGSSKAAPGSLEKRVCSSCNPSRAKKKEVYMIPLFPDTPSGKLEFAREKYRVSNIGDPSTRGGCPVCGGYVLPFASLYRCEHCLTEFRGINWMDGIVKVGPESKAAPENDKPTELVPEKRRRKYDL